MQDKEKDIAPKYLALVERFKAEPKKSVERLKMLIAFDPWFRSHADSLTEDEKNIFKKTFIMSIWTKSFGHTPIEMYQFGILIIADGHTLSNDRNSASRSLKMPYTSISSTIMGIIKRICAFIHCPGHKN